MRLIPATMVRLSKLTVTPIQATATATAVLTTALIGAKVDALLAELIGDGIAGIKRKGLSSPRRQLRTKMRGVVRM